MARVLFCNCVGNKPERLNKIMNAKGDAKHVTCRIYHDDFKEIFAWWDPINNIFAWWYPSSFVLPDMTLTTVHFTMFKYEQTVSRIADNAWLLAELEPSPRFCCTWPPFGGIGSCRWARPWSRVRDLTASPWDVAHDADSGPRLMRGCRCVGQPRGLVRRELNCAELGSISESWCRCTDSLRQICSAGRTGAVEEHAPCFGLPCLLNNWILSCIRCFDLCKCIRVCCRGWGLNQWGRNKDRGRRRSESTKPRYSFAIHFQHCNRFHIPCWKFPCLST